MYYKLFIDLVKQLLTPYVPKKGKTPKHVKIRGSDTDPLYILKRRNGIKQTLMPQMIGLMDI